jgi:hypothetical protein
MGERAWSEPRGRLPRFLNASLAVQVQPRTVAG